MVDLFRERKWDLVGYHKLWFAISLAVILTGAYHWSSRGLNYGIDFTGGGLVKYQLAKPVAPGEESETLAKAREAIEQAGVNARLQISGTATRKDQLLVRTRLAVAADEASDVLDEQKSRMLNSLAAVLPGIEEVESELVTPVVSKELIKKAVWAVAWGCLFILFWIRIRYFDFKWAGAALVALVHDVLILIGVFAITQREINSPFVAAALTVVGYSVHDTIVLFDRIRENLRLRKGNTFAETANISLLETMARSVNTVFTVLLVLMALYVLGGASLRNFTFALLVGMTAGGYSSIFTAAQVLVLLKKREERAVARRRATAGRPARAAQGRRAPAAQPRAVRPGPTEQGQEPSAGMPSPERPGEERPAAEVEASAAAAAATPDQKRERRPRDARRKLKAGRKRKKRF